MSGPFDSSERRDIRRLVREELRGDPDGSGVPQLLLAGVDVDPDGDGQIESLGRYQDLADVERSSTFISANATVSEEIVGVDTGAGAVTATIASAVAEAGRQVVVTDVGGAAGTNAITVATEGTETIDGATSTSISSNYGEIRLVSDGVNWFTW